MARTSNVLSNLILAIPDFQGGLVGVVVLGQNAGIVKLDGITGQPYPIYTAPGGFTIFSSTSGGRLLAVRLDGTIFVKVAVAPPSVSQALVGIDSTTGSQKFMVTVPDNGGEAGIIIAGDGDAYVPYYVMAQDWFLQPSAPFHLGLLRISSSGT